MDNFAAKKYFLPFFARKLIFLLRNMVVPNSFIYLADLRYNFKKMKATR